MSTDLTRREEGGAVIPGLGNTEVSFGDIALPRLSVTQALSQAVMDDKAKQGHFYNSLTEQDYGTIVHFIPAMMFRNRVRLVAGQGLVCRSLDMEQGIGDPGIECAKCDYKEWPSDLKRKGKKVEGNRRAPECGISHNWLGLIVAKPPLDGQYAIEPCDPEMVIVQWRSSAAATAKQLSGLHMNAALMNNTIAWHDRTYMLAVESKQNDLGRFFIPSVKLVGQTSEEHREVARRLLKLAGSRTWEYEPTPEDDVDTSGENGGSAPTDASGVGF